MAAANLVRTWFSSVRRRVLFFTLSTVGLLGLVILYSQINAQVVLQGLWQTWQRQDLLVKMSASAQGISEALEGYLASKGSEKLLQFNRLAEGFEAQRRELAGRPALTLEGANLQRAVVALAGELLTEAGKAVAAKRARDETAYPRAFDRTQILLGYLQVDMDQLNLTGYRASLDQASEFYSRLGYLQVSNALMLFSLLGLVILVSFWFSRRLSSPLEQLSQAAIEISRGNYSFDLPPLGMDEVGRLALAFDRMRQAIVNHIAEIRKTALIERENLEMKALLKNAEYQALQAQINPHFLFNTLNAASQLAMMEEAPETEKFLFRLAHLMRHNIRKLDQPVTLTEELQSLEHYLYIVRLRFGKRITFRLERQAGEEGILLPPMTLQPLVENAVLHGLKDKLAEGLVEITTAPADGGVAVEIRDNGIGIEPERLQRLLNEKDGAGTGETTGQSTGIGLGNVLQRLNLFFGRSDVARITSQPGAGTCIRLTLPRSEGNP